MYVSGMLEGRTLRSLARADSEPVFVGWSSSLAGTARDRDCGRTRASAIKSPAYDGGEKKDKMQLRTVCVVE